MMMSHLSFSVRFFSDAREIWQKMCLTPLKFNHKICPLHTYPFHLLYRCFYCEDIDTHSGIKTTVKEVAISHNAAKNRFVRSVLELSFSLSPSLSLRLLDACLLLSFLDHSIFFYSHPLSLSVSWPLSSNRLKHQLFCALAREQKLIQFINSWIVLLDVSWLFDNLFEWTEKSGENWIDLVV